jgi:hypothetical protein
LLDPLVLEGEEECIKRMRGGVASVLRF